LEFLFGPDKPEAVGRKSPSPSGGQAQFSLSGFVPITVPSAVGFRFGGRTALCRNARGVTLDFPALAGGGSRGFLRASGTWRHGDLACFQNRLLDYELATIHGLNENIGWL
jgi:hypothetical protein